MAAAITVIATTSNNTPVSNTINTAGGWAVGDVAIVLIFDTAAGGVATFALSGASTTQQLESPASAGAAWSPTTSDRDNHTDDSYAGGIFVSAYSARIEAIDATHGFTASCTYGGSSGTRRSIVLRLRPDTGKTIPTRGSRVISIGSKTGGAGGGSTSETFSMSAGPGTEDIALLVGYYAGANVAGGAPTYDADNTGAPGELNTTFASSNAGAFSKIYAAADSPRPNGSSPFTERICWSTNPTSTQAELAIVYRAETHVNTITGTATLAGGGALTTTGTVKVPGTLTLVGGGSLSTTGKRTTFGTLTLVGGGTLHLDRQGITTITGTATLIGGGTHTLHGSILRTGTMTLVGGGVHALTGTRKTTGTASLIGGGTFHADQLTSVTTYQAGGSWAAGSHVRVGGRTFTGTAAFAGGGTFAAVGQKAGRFGGILVFGGGGVLQLTGKRTVHATMNFTGGGVLRMGQTTPADPPDRLTVHRVGHLRTDRSSRTRLDY